MSEKYNNKKDKIKLTDSHTINGNLILKFQFNMKNNQGFSINILSLTTNKILLTIWEVPFINENSRVFYNTKNK